MRLALAVCGIILAGCQRKTEPPPHASGPAFRDVAPETGLRFQHLTGATGKFYMPEIMGAGAALLDFDADGDLDVFLVQGTPFEDPSQGSGNRLFRNELIPSGRLSFTGVTEAAGLRHSAYGMGAATGDFDNDGNVDLLVTNFGPNVLYRNLGNGRFEDVTAQSPSIRKSGEWSTSASFFDYDRDGWLDLIILTYVDFSVRANKQCYAPTGEMDYCTPVAYRPLPARLYHNERGRFVDVTAQAGIDRARGPGLGVVALDAGQDGWPDLFVANDTAANHFWVNRRNGTFEELALQRGVAYSENGQPKAGMGVAAGDYDNDGREDLLVLNLMREGATLFHNDENGSFSDVSLASRIHPLSFPYTGFGVGWFDFDNDGHLDLFFANGAVTRREEQRGHAYPFAEKNLLLRNSAGRFEEVTDRAGDAMRLLEVSRGAVFGDIDNDGRVDILLTNNNGPVRLLRNESRAGNWLTIDVGGPGAWVGVFPDGGRPLWRRSRTDSSYLSAGDPRVHFGLGEASRVQKVTIVWPGGSSQHVPEPPVNTQLRIRPPSSSRK